MLEKQTVINIISVQQILKTVIWLKHQQFMTYLLKKQVIMIRVPCQRSVIWLKHQQFIINMLRELAVLCQKRSMMSLKHTLCSAYLLKKQAETQLKSLNMQSLSSTQSRIVQQTLQLWTSATQLIMLSLIFKLRIVLLLTLLKCFNSCLLTHW